VPNGDSQVTFDVSGKLPADAVFLHGGVIRLDASYQCASERQRENTWAELSRVIVLHGLFCRVLMNGYATVDLDDGATNNDPPALILIVVDGTVLINISTASIFLGLSRRQSAVAPPRLFAVTPSWRTIV